MMTGCQKSKKTLITALPIINLDVLKSVKLQVNNTLKEKERVIFEPRRGEPAQPISQKLDNYLAHSAHILQCLYYIETSQNLDMQNVYLPR